MLWRMSYRASPSGVALYDRHYTRQTHGGQLAPPGRALVLQAVEGEALWVSSWQRYARHAWQGAWVCSVFRRESGPLASALVRDAVAATRWAWGSPPEGGLVIRGAAFAGLGSSSWARRAARAARARCSCSGSLPRTCRRRPRPWGRSGGSLPRNIGRSYRTCSSTSPATRFPCRDTARC